MRGINKTEMEMLFKIILDQFGHTSSVLNADRKL